MHSFFINMLFVYQYAPCLSMGDSMPDQHSHRTWPPPPILIKFGMLIKHPKKLTHVFWVFFTCVVSDAGRWILTKMLYPTRVKRSYLPTSIRSLFICQNQYAPWNNIPKDPGHESCSHCALAGAAEFALGILWRNINFSLLLLLLYTPSLYRIKGNWKIYMGE